MPKPSKALCLRNAQFGYELLETREAVRANTSVVLNPTVTHMITRNMWWWLMLWAGMPMRLSESEL